MSFGQPLWFFGFAFLPVLIVLFARNESRRSKLLKQLVAARLQGRLAGTVSLGLRRLRFALFLLGLAALLVSLTQPRYGYTWEESKRQGRDILIAIDCSRSMLATDVNPSRLGRAKLATQDLISQLQGDRVGLIAFEGTAFLQAPLTIDYSAVLDSLAVLDTNVIPRGGTNIAAAIMEADAAFGKGESDNRCLIIFTDGEELEDDAVAAAAAEKEHMRIFTVGLGSTDGSLIPVPTENGGTEFVKDDNGQFVKSRLDEDRLRKIAESTGGFYVHLQNGPAEMKQIIQDGLGKMKEKDIDARLSRRPIERYEWPLSAALVLLVASMLIGERKRPTRRVGPPPPPSRVEPPPLPRVEPPPLPRMAALLLLLLPLVAHAKNSGLEAYEQKDYKGAMSEFDRQLQQRKDSAALNFDLGAAAYKSGDLAKALEAFAKAVTSPDPKLRAAAEYNLGNTLFQQGQATEQKEKRVQTWKDALEHYEQALKVTPGNKDAEYNRDVVRRLLEEMEKQPPKDQQQQQQQNKKDDQKKDDQKKDQQNQQNQQQNKNSQNKDQKDQQQNQQQQQQQQKSGGSQDQDKNQQQSQSQQQQQSQSQQSQGSSGQQQQQQQQQGQQGNAQQDKDQQNGKDGQQNQPQPQNGEKGDKSDEKKDSQQNPSQGNPQSPQQAQDGQGEPLKPAPDDANKKREGEIQTGNAQSAQKADPQQEAAAEAEAAKEGKMTPDQAKTLLESLRGEDERVQLLKPAGKPHEHNFRNW